jgi:stage II sporulation protein D
VQSKAGISQFFFFVAGIFFLVETLYSQKVQISLYNEKPLNSVIISAMKGTYRVIADSAFLMVLNNENAVYLSMFDGNILVRNAQKPLGYFRQIRFEAEDSSGIFKVKPIGPSLEGRQYDGCLSSSIAYNRILLVNELDIDKYIGGVVEAETGSNAGFELYKAQAVLARTYTFAYIKKHEEEGFNLCDGVHCQAYHGRASRNILINNAANATSGLVVVTKDTTFITAAFHSNCGGYTESAKNAWLIDKSYLVPVKDPYCQTSPQARWTEKIPLTRWESYLKSHRFRIPKGLPYIEYNFVQTERVPYYVVRNDSIPFKQIRSDFKLKSGFFSVSASSTEITLKGRGFGHGVGLCQEGAIYMAKVGYKFDEILKFYFKGIRIISINELNDKTQRR